MAKSEIRNPKSETNPKSQCPKFQTPKFRSLVIWSLVLIWNLVLGAWNLSAQESELELSLDTSADTIPLPQVFKPSVDLSGRGYHRDISWPQGLAAAEAIDAWQKDIGFSLGFYRLQYNLWEITQLAKDKIVQDKLLANYEAVIKRVSDAGGTVILDIFGTPAGMGKVLDKKSPPVNLKAFKELLKGQIRKLSCEKRYNIWYEVWSAPDLDDFFLGREQEYLNLYRAIAEAVEELEEEFKTHIPLGGPSVSSWFQNIEPNTIASPEHSLIYDLIKFCYQYRLPLDFISWHSFSTDPAPEEEATIYKKPVTALIRDWLTYFKFKPDTPLIIDEWNYDRRANILAERQAQSYITASYIPARLLGMYRQGLANQVYFSLEDFQNNKEGVVRNTGVFWFDPEYSGYKGAAKAIYNSLRMLKMLGNELLPLEFGDRFSGAIATKDKEKIVILIYNYTDPEIATDFLSRNVAELSPDERRVLLDIVRTDKLSRILSGQLDIVSLRASGKVKQLLDRAQDLNYQAAKYAAQERGLKLKIKKPQSVFSYQRYVLDSSSERGYHFKPREEKETDGQDIFQESLILEPYSLNLILLEPKPAEAKEESKELPKETPKENPKEEPKAAP
jgi:hypothetical protein